MTVKNTKHIQTILAESYLFYLNSRFGFVSRGTSHIAKKAQEKRGGANRRKLGHTGENNECSTVGRGLQGGDNVTIGRSVVFCYELRLSGSRKKEYN